jgi:hypothetical protein
MNKNGVFYLDLRRTEKIERKCGQLPQFSFPAVVFSIYGINPAMPYYYGRGKDNQIQGQLCYLSRSQD